VDIAEKGITEKVLEHLGITESAAIALKREDGGKIRVTSLLWSEPKVILKGEVLEVHNVDRRLRIARKERHSGEGDPSVEGLRPLWAGR
jgi:hypothetical protein